MKTLKTLLISGAAIGTLFYLIGSQAPLTPRPAQAADAQSIGGSLEVSAYINTMSPSFDLWLTSLHEGGDYCSLGTLLQCVMALDRVRVSSQALLQQMESSEYPQCIKESQQILAKVVRLEIEITDGFSRAIRTNNVLALKRAVTRQQTVVPMLRDVTARLSSEKDRC